MGGLDLCGRSVDRHGWVVSVSADVLDGLATAQIHRSMFLLTLKKLGNFSVAKLLHDAR